MSEIITAYYKRFKGTVDGLFTIQSHNPATRQTQALFSRHPARSGQPGYADTEWIQGKSPIPVGRFHLWLHPVPLQFSPVGTPFFPISSSLENRKFLRDSLSPKQREDVGLHLENEFTGTLCCIALLHDTRVQKAYTHAIFEFLKTLGETRKTIDLVVIR